MPDIDDLERRVINLEERTDMEFGLAASRDRDISEIKQKLDAHERILQALHHTQADHGRALVRLENKMIGLDNRVAGLDNRVAGLDNRVAGLDNRVAGLDNRVTGMHTEMQLGFAGIVVRLDRLLGESEPPAQS